jgi:hypothetical protein
MTEIYKSTAIVQDPIKRADALHKSYLPSTGTEQGEFLAPTDTNMSTQEIERPSECRYVLMAYGQHEDGLHRHLQNNCEAVWLGCSIPVAA